jgi:hypothetical protein
MWTILLVMPLFLAEHACIDVHWKDKLALVLVLQGGLLELAPGEKPDPCFLKLCFEKLFFFLA